VMYMAVMKPGDKKQIYEGPDETLKEQQG